MEEKDKEHKEYLNTSLLTGFDGRAWSEEFWRQGLSVKMEMGRIRKRMQQTAALDALGEQKALVRQVGTRGAPWNVTVFVMGTAIQVSHGLWEMWDVLDVASVLASRNCEVCASVFT